MFAKSLEIRSNKTDLNFRILILLQGICRNWKVNGWGLYLMMVLVAKISKKSLEILTRRLLIGTIRTCKSSEKTLNRTLWSRFSTFRSCPKNLNVSSPWSLSRLNLSKSTKFSPKSSNLTQIKPSTKFKETLSWPISGDSWNFTLMKSWPNTLKLHQNLKKLSESSSFLAFVVSAF